MATAQERAHKHEVALVDFELRLDAWATVLDARAAEIVAVGAQDHDPYRMRIATQRRALDDIVVKIRAFRRPTPTVVAWGPFYGDLVASWKALDSACKELTS